MKFISKFGNLQIILKPSLPGEPLAGKLPEPGISARFEGGILETHDEEMIARLKRHPGFGSDYVVLEDDQPFTPRSMEPEHDIIDIEYGHMGANKNPRPAVKLTPEMTKALSEIAAGMATEMFKKMMADAAASAQQMKEEKLPAEPVTSPVEEEKESEGPTSPVESTPPTKTTKSKK